MQRRASPRCSGLIGGWVASTFAGITAARTTLGRSAPRDAVAMALLRRVPASRAVGLRRRGVAAKTSKVSEDMIMSVSGTSHSKEGFVHGGPRLLLRIEALAYAALALIGYAHSGYSWWLFAGFILVPDVSMLGYIIGPSIGAAAYNLVHTLTLPILLLFGAALFANMLLLAIGTIWIVHMGADRALGYGLKYATGFAVPISVIPAEANCYCAGPPAAPNAAILARRCSIPAGAEITSASCRFRSCSGRSPAPQPVTSQSACRVRRGHDR
jgi:hypothetical protein